MFIRVYLWLIFFSAVVVAPTIFAQQPPRVAYVYPAGGKQGGTFTAVIGGQFFFQHDKFLRVRG